MIGVREHVWTLCLWWSFWSLSDRYLARFGPWSEVFVLAVCVLTYGAQRVPKVCNRAKQELAAVTQSHPGVQVPPYSAQKDVA